MAGQQKGRSWECHSAQLERSRGSVTAVETTAMVQGGDGNRRPVQARRSWGRGSTLTSCPVTLAQEGSTRVHATVTTTQGKQAVVHFNTASELPSRSSIVQGHVIVLGHTANACHCFPASDNVSKAPHASASTSALRRSHYQCTAKGTVGRQR